MQLYQCRSLHCSFFVAVVIIMTLVAVVTLVDVVTFVTVIESHCDDRIVWIPLCRFHRVDSIV